MAVGGIATGAFALGQVAFGVVAMGQGSVGLFTVGMMSAALHVCFAMSGVGGGECGGVVPLAPWLGPASEPPDATRLAAVRDGAEGWVALDLAADGTGIVGADEPARLDTRCVEAAREPGEGPVFAWLERGPHGFVATRLMERRPPRWKQSRFWKMGGVQLICLSGTAVAIWFGVIETLISVLWPL